MCRVDSAPRPASARVQVSSSWAPANTRRCSSAEQTATCLRDKEGYRQTLVRPGQSVWAWCRVASEGERGERRSAYVARRDTRPAAADGGWEGGAARTAADALAGLDGGLHLQDGVGGLDIERQALAGESLRRRRRWWRRRLTPELSMPTSPASAACWVRARRAGTHVGSEERLACFGAVARGEGGSRAHLREDLHGLSRRAGDMCGDNVQ